MIFLITGKPRNGKTLYAIDHIEKLRIKENRTVYYNYIDDLKLDWVEFKDPKTWNELPNGAIIVFDEAHKVFPARANGSRVPEHVAPFDEHGHKGYDVFIITQDPKGIDPYIIARTQNHKHVVRKFGGNKAVIHEWPTGVNKSAVDQRRDSITSNYNYNKALFGMYKSADIHTVKRSIPMRYILLLCMPVIILALAYFGFSGLLSTSDEAAQIADDKIKSDTQSQPFHNNNQDNNKNQNEPLTAIQYVNSMQPRIEGLPHTAPHYDEITQPSRVPVPAACVTFKDKCTCFTQTGTKLPTPDNLCRQIVENGFFLDFNPDQNYQVAQTQPVQSVGVSGQSPDVDQQHFTVNDTPSRASPSNN